MAHFYTGVNPVSCALRGRTALTPECQGGFPSLRSGKGPRPLRRFAAIPARQYAVPELFRKARRAATSVKRCPRGMGISPSSASVATDALLANSDLGLKTVCRYESFCCADPPLSTRFISFR